MQSTDELRSERWVLVEVFPFRNALQANDLFLAWGPFVFICSLCLSLPFHPLPMCTARVTAKEFSYSDLWLDTGYYQISSFSLFPLMGHVTIKMMWVGDKAGGDRGQNLKELICQAVNLTKIVFSLSQSQ